MVVSAFVWIFFALASRRDFAEPWRAATLRALLAMAGYWFAIYAYRAMLFFVTYATT